MAPTGPMFPDSLIPEEPAWRSWPLFLALGTLVGAGLVLLFGWQEEQQRRELLQLAANQARLRSQLRELSQRRQLLAEYEKLTVGQDFYVVLEGQVQEGHLRLRDRTLRRFNWRANPGVPAPGVYRLVSANQTHLDWNGLVTVAEPSVAPCTEESVAAGCVVLPPEDWTVLARTLKPGSPLLLLP